jgi:hypothetical protein
VNKVPAVELIGTNWILFVPKKQSVFITLQIIKHQIKQPTLVPCNLKNTTRAVLQMQDAAVAGSYELGNEPLGYLKGGEFL